MRRRSHRLRPRKGGFLVESLHFEVELIEGRPRRAIFARIGLCVIYIITQTEPGEALVLRGHFPVARVADLRVQLKGQREALELAPTDVDGGVRVEVPGQTAPGDWQLLTGTVDGLTPLQGITTVRVM